MSTTYYKAVRPDGTDFFTGKVDYLADGIGTVVSHPAPHDHDASGYLSVSVSPSDCTGFQWPARLLVVKPVKPWTPAPVSLPSKRATSSLRVVAERPAHELFGPNGEQVIAFLILPLSVRNVARRAGAGRVAVLYAARDAAWDAARDAARHAAWDAARSAAWYAVQAAVQAPERAAVQDVAWDAVQDAMRALVVRDLISAEHFEVLTAPMRAAGVDFDALTVPPSPADTSTTPSRRARSRTSWWARFRGRPTRGGTDA